MATRNDFNEKFARVDAAIASIQAKIANAGMSAAEEDQVAADLEAHTVNLEDLAK